MKRSILGVCEKHILKLSSEPVQSQSFAYEFIKQTKPVQGYADSVDGVFNHVEKL